MKKPAPATTIEEIRKRLGKNIARARKEKGWMQAKLAEHLGMEPVSLSRIETGNSLPGVERLIELAGVLNVSVTHLLDGASQNFSDQAEQVAASMERLSPSDRNLVVSVVTQLADRLAKK